MNFKTIMAAAAVCAAASLQAVESGIVGYGPSALQLNGMTASSSFVPVSGTKIDLTDLVGKGYESDPGYCDAYIQIQTLNEFGQTQATYVWMDDGQGESAEWYGWYPLGEETKVKKGDVEIQPGEGLWTYCSIEGLSVQGAGSVETATDIVVTLQLNGLSVANPTPINVDLVDTYATGYEEDPGYCDAYVQVQTLNEFGQTQATYVWMDDGQGESAEWYGWYPLGEETPVARETVVVLPGQGLWTYCSVAGFYFNWPKVDIK